MKVFLSSIKTTIKSFEIKSKRKKLYVRYKTNYSVKRIVGVL